MCTVSGTPTHTQLTQLFSALRHNRVQLRLSFRHRACSGVIALLINVSLSQDNGLVFTVRFFRLAMRDIQWCNLLSVHYALHGSPWGTLFPVRSQVTHLSMHFFSRHQSAFHSHKAIDLESRLMILLTLENVIFIWLYDCFFFSKVLYVLQSMIVIQVDMLYWQVMIEYLAITNGKKEKRETLQACVSGISPRRSGTLSGLIRKHSTDTKLVSF